MKVFWSWQSDTPGKISRHFVRAVLADAIKTLKEPEELGEPSERDAREALHLDHDRQGVPGSPDLAPTIFGKIDQAAVFVADVTLVAETSEVAVGGKEGRRKKLINSNVGIEYGYALRSLGDAYILMVQNVHYGSRDELPFDLKHKAGPIQYCLAPEATKAEIVAEHAKLRSILVEQLRPYIGRVQDRESAPHKFDETPSTTNIAVFWNPSEILATLGSVVSRVRQRPECENQVEYRFNEPHAFYLRLIPTAALSEALPITKLTDLVERRRVQLLTRTLNSGMPGRNRFGAITYGPDVASTTPTAISQLFRNGEVWGVSRDFALHHDGALVVPMGKIKNVFGRVLANFVEVAAGELDIPAPYQIEMGAVGLKDMCVSLPQSPQTWRNQVSQPIYEDELRLRRVLDDAGPVARNALLGDFLRMLYDLAAVEIE